MSAAARLARLEGKAPAAKPVFLQVAFVPRACPDDSTFYRVSGGSCAVISAQEYAAAQARGEA